MCMLGASGVGKTSLVQQFVKSIYTEKYHLTIGVKIDKKQVSVDGREVTLLLWDLQGEDETHKVRPSFLRGASGYLLVVDLTRSETLEVAVALQAKCEEEFGDLPFIVLFNKNDLTGDIRIGERELEKITTRGWKVFSTSAKTGENVEQAFVSLAGAMLK